MGLIDILFKVLDGITGVISLATMLPWRWGLVVWGAFIAVAGLLASAAWVTGFGATMVGIGVVCLVPTWLEGNGDARND